MLDNGWQVLVWKNPRGSYTAQGVHKSYEVWIRAKTSVLEKLKTKWPESEAVDLVNHDFCDEGAIDTDDFTPEQALTRLAYKVHGQII